MKKFVVLFPFYSQYLPLSFDTFDEARMSASRFPLPGLVALASEAITPSMMDVVTPAFPHRDLYLCYGELTYGVVTDALVINSEGKLRGGYGDKWLADIQQSEEGENRPWPVLVTLAVAQQVDEDRYCLPPVEQTEEQFMDMLECLPPQGWHNTAEGESFYMMEFLTGPITTYHVRIGKRYFCFNSKVISHQEALVKVELAIANGEKS